MIVEAAEFSSDKIGRVIQFTTNGSTASLS
ncbi:hypothetical protein X759_31305 [Mesorhizobium sp. LSHC420B00]|nr:hypothetical protein X759_31305 [Mesorhizobium sp. LSHC420B00]